MSPTYGNARFGSEAKRIGRPGNGSRGWPKTGSHDPQSFTTSQMHALPSPTRCGASVREFRLRGSVRGARGNSRPYRDHPARAPKTTRMTDTVEKVQKRKVAFFPPEDETSGNRWSIYSQNRRRGHG